MWQLTDTGFTHTTWPRKPDYVSWKRVLRTDPCSYCGGPSGTIDHILPQSRGGKKRDNRTGACESCNIAKSNISLLLFMLVRLDPSLRKTALRLSR